MTTALLHFLRTFLPAPGWFLTCSILLFFPQPGQSSPAHEGKPWALRPLIRTSPPNPPATAPFQSAVDSFIAARHGENGLSMSPPADRRTLIRRATSDLTGLLPTPGEVENFLTDPRPDAFAHLVDRLLDSPRYGEHWTRHWMDIVHYAETQGHDEDAIRENAWPYRDYLIQSFNQDKPLARFIQEQVAGDILFPEDPQALVAISFLASGPWDGSSQMGIQDGTIDKKIAQYLDRDDMLTTAMGTFVSLTVHCARCHDHKFDPITQEDYYALQAVFAGVDRADRPYDPDPSVHRKRRALLREKELLEQKKIPPATLAHPEFKEELARWEQAQAQRLELWTVVKPESVDTEQEPRQTIARPGDGSLLLGGPRPEKDTLLVRGQIQLKRITAVQLEVLTDPALPLQGPGRQDNGNLHLSEFSLALEIPPEAGDADAKTLTRNIPLKNPEADFNQAGWTIAMALDKNPRTAWGIYPQVGQPHRAIFELDTPLMVPSKAALVFRLDQLHGGGHLVGRPRLSVTDADSPGISEPLPENVHRLLVIPSSDRSPDQHRELARYYLEQRNQRQLKSLPEPKKIFAVANDFSAQGNFKPALQPRPVHFLNRGDVRQPGPLAQPGALSCLPELPARFDLEKTAPEGARRAALARWLTAPQNALTWRSMANRIWQYHFGQGIVATPNDFGKMGTPPTHPQLLDWLACELRDHQGSLKHLHRVIMNSEVYQQSSRTRDLSPAGQEIDPDNQFLSRMNLRRREAESIRDSLLQLGGNMDWTMGGPSDRQFLLSKGVHVTPALDYIGFDPDQPANWRRSIYRFVFRTVPDPFMQALDCPDASQWVPRRTESVTPTQALALLNNRFLIRQSQHTAQRLEQTEPDLRARINQLFLLAYSRPVTEEEWMSLEVYVGKHGLANTCRMIMNSNEFLFVE